MRNPNGYGGISYLGENRRNPFRVRITAGWEYDEKTGKQKQKYNTIGYFPTRKAAMIALAKYNENPYDLNASKLTFEDIYNKWHPAAFSGLSTSAIAAYRSAYQKFEKLHKMPMSEIKKPELQSVFDDCKELSKVYQEKMKYLAKSLFNYCIEYDLLEKDYTQFIRMYDNNKKESIHTPYTEEEIKLLWDNLDMTVPLQTSKGVYIDIAPVDIILIMIYTGMRPSEVLKQEIEKIHLEEKYMIGGLKTDAGIDRIIPLHDDIVPLIKKRMDEGGKYLIKYKSDKPPSLNAYRLYMYDPVITELGIKHLPHDGRHTFATFADKALISEHMVKRIMGHTIKDITQGVYTHKDASELVEAVNKITFLET